MSASGRSWCQTSRHTLTTLDNVHWKWYNTSMRSNRRLVRKYRKVITECAVREANRMAVPIMVKMWMNYEILRQGQKIRESRINKKRT